MTDHDQCNKDWGITSCQVLACLCFADVPLDISSKRTAWCDYSEPALGRLYADLGLGFDAPNAVDEFEKNFAEDHVEGSHTFGLAVPRQPAKARQQKASRQSGAATLVTAYLLP